MRIGITLNDVVRDFTSNFDEVYNNYISSLEGVAPQRVLDISQTDLSPSAEVKTSEVEKQSRKVLDLPYEDDPFGISKEYEFTSKEEFDNILWDDLAFEVFGKAEQKYAEAMQDLNKVYNQFISDGHSVSVVSQERKNSKPATLLFLSQNKFYGNNIKFLYNYSKVWQLYDLIITTNPLILAAKPKDKKTIKIQTPYNEHIESDLTKKDLHEVYQYYMINKK